MHPRNCIFHQLNRTKPIRSKFLWSSVGKACDCMIEGSEVRALPTGNIFFFVPHLQQIFNLVYSKTEFKIFSLFSSHAALQPILIDFSLALCPRGWVSHLMNGTDMVYCYLVRHNTHTWYMARNDCIRSRSDLLSISNAKEQEFVTKHLLAESFMWIGYNDIQREGQWAWSDR